MSSTKVACPVSAYWDFLNVLPAVRSYEVTGEKLLLRCGEGRDAQIVFDRYTGRSSGKDEP